MQGSCHDPVLLCRSVTIIKLYNARLLPYHSFIVQVSYHDQVGAPATLEFYCATCSYHDVSLSRLPCLCAYSHSHTPSKQMYLSKL